MIPKAKWDTAENVEDLARVIMSETSAKNEPEAIAVGYTVLNRMAKSNADTVRKVWRAYARNQAPTKKARAIAAAILTGSATDLTDGATHFYSPRSMPFEGDDIKGFDVRGGLEKIDGLKKRNYRPSWAIKFDEIKIAGISPARFKFYRPT